MKITLTASSIQKVVDAGANHWTKGDFDRYYIDVKDLVDYDFYKSGNVCHAKMNGEKISNTRGTELLYTKIYVDMATSELVCSDEELFELAVKNYGLEEEKAVEEVEPETEEVEESTDSEEAEAADTKVMATDDIKNLMTETFKKAKAGITIEGKGSRVRVLVDTPDSYPVRFIINQKYTKEYDQRGLLKKLADAMHQYRNQDVDCFYPDYPDYGEQLVVEPEYKALAPVRARYIKEVADKVLQTANEI